MVIYLSGAMASCMDTYKEIFEAKKKELEAKGHIVLNPAALPNGLNPNGYMPICLAMIDAAEAIYLFNNWENSRGALLEKEYAEHQRKGVLYG